MGASDARAAIREAFADCDALDAASAARILEAYPEHADLLLLLPQGLRDAAASATLKLYPSRAVACLIDGGLFAGASESLVLAAQARLEAGEPALIPVVAEFIASGDLSAAGCAAAAKGQAPLFAALCRAGATGATLAEFARAMADASQVAIAIGLAGASLKASALASVLEAAFAGESGLAIKIALARLAEGYSTELARLVFEAEGESDAKTLSLVPDSTLLLILRDPGFSVEEKISALSLAPADRVEALMAAGDEWVNRLCLLSSDAWPTSALDPKQGQVLQSLGAGHYDHKLKAFFIRSVVEGDLLLSAAAIAGLPSGLYGELMGAVGKAIEEEGGESYLPAETIDAIMESRRKPLPPGFCLIVLKFNKDWRKLAPDDQVALVEYAAAQKPEAIAAEEAKGQVGIFLKGRPVASIVGGELALASGLAGLSGEARAQILRVGAVGIGLPPSFRGDYYMKTGEFVPTEDDIPAKLLRLRFGLDEETRKSLAKISENIVIRDLVAKRRGGPGSIAFEVEVSQQEALEELAKSGDVLERAKKLHRKLKRIKKNTEGFLESMAMIDEGENRKFGVELEIASPIPRQALARKLGRGTRATDEHASSRGWGEWEVKFDMSVGGEHSIDEEDLDALTAREIGEKIIDHGGFSAELVSPVLRGRDGIEELKRVLTRLNKVVHKDGVGLEVGELSETGLHVHHSIEDLIARVGQIEEGSEIALEMGKYIMSVQGALYALCSKWRLESQFARPLKEPGELKGPTRYGFAVSQYGTLEYRLKEATFSVEAIIRWVVLTQQVTMSLIESVNSDTAAAKEKLKQALDGGLDMLMSDRAEGRGSLIAHLALYQAAADFALVS
jgi:hypothetical protein